MACIYNYRGHIFNSELELDNFLLEKEKYYDKYKDLVFSSSKERQFAVANQLEAIRQEGEKDQGAANAYRKAQRENKIKYGEDGEESIEQPPYIGVNAFLASIEGERLFPEFRIEIYWTERFKAWAEGNFNDTEIEIFNYDKNNLPKITDSNVAKDLREKIEQKWKVQGEIGDAIHKVLEVYFNRKDDKYVFETENFEQYIINHLEPKHKKYLFDSTGKPINSAFKDTLHHAQELRAELQRKLGENLIFLPEFIISGDATHPDTGKIQTLIGKIDLLVIDSEGRVHIVDYKTSVKDYDKYNKAKQLAYRYQTATYRRILQRKGIDVYEGRLIISPIKITNFRVEGDTYVYDGVKSDLIIDEITNTVTEKNQARIDNFMPAPFNVTVTAEDVHLEVSKIMAEWFPKYSSTRQITRDQLIKELERQDKLKPNDKGEYIYKPYDTKVEPIVATSKTEFIDKVLDYRQKRIPWRLSTTGNVKAQLKEAIKNGPDNVDWIKQKNRGESISWLRDYLYKYCNDAWRVVDNEVLESYGIIMLRNSYTQQVDFIRISTDLLYTNYRAFLDKKDPIKNRLGLTGTFEPDVVEQSKSDSLMLEGVSGNIELMETMAVINQLQGLDNVIVGEISVINPYDSAKVSASNEELLYCFNALNKHKAMPQNKFDKGTIRLANRYRILVNQFRDIMIKAEASNYRDVFRGYKTFESCRDLISRAVDGTVDAKLAALTELKEKMENDPVLGKIVQKIYTDSRSLNDDTISLYSTILATITQLKGINLRQQLKDHSEWLEKAMILRHGWSGTYLDNPGNLDSQTLNLVTKLVTEAYQNTRDEMQTSKNRIRKALDKFKAAKGYTAAMLNLGANQVNIYKNLIIEVPTEQGTDLMFQDINNITDPNEKEFLEFVLDEINKDRFPNMSETEREQRKNSYDTQYYRVPLARGGADSQISSKGLMALFRDKIHSWNPKVAFQRAREKIEGIYNAEETTKSQQGNEAIFEMTNMFDRGEESTETRLNAIKRNGIHTFERNIETLLLKHNFAYIQQRNINKVFPLIKAAAIHLAQQGAAQNIKFDKDLGYMNDYIRNKIKNESIINPDFESAMQIANRIKKAASIFSLAFSPVQAIYQPLQGLWQDISLMIRKPDGKNSFTFEHFRNSIKIVGRDLFHFSDKPTLCSSLNELYGLNDMDMNTYAERISKAKKGIWNFTNLAFKFASRPDYYNRMVIFLSQMQGDGCLEAHTMVNGELKYDWKKDKRFEAFANGWTSDPRYNEQRALYYAVAQQFVNEHALDLEGNEFKLNMNNPVALPRAYTNKQAEGMKSLSDNIYGYYSHEKKSMVMSTGLGAMWLQFKTFWSGKKNQYLQSGGVRIQGKWEQKTERDKDGKLVKYYYQVDANGAIKYDEPLTTEETIAPAMQWKGQWQEGILVTLSDLIYQTIQDPKHFLDHLNEKWNNPDDNLRNCYKSNIKQFGYDMIMFFVIGSLLGAWLGDWLDELEDENKKNTDFVVGLKLAAANVAVMSVKNSFLDLNWLDSIGTPLGQWTPFALDWGARQWKNISKVATGDEDIWDGILNIATVNKQVRPIFDSIKPEMFRTKREGGTWESATVKRNREKRENRD